MGFHDKHLDVLQNIEFPIVQIYRERPELTDYEVMRGLDVIIDAYRAEERKRTAKPREMDELESAVFDGIKKMCEYRLGRSNPEDSTPAETSEPTHIRPLPVIIDCLKTIRKSVERWNREGGRQGYLNFVSQYVK